MWIGLYSDLKVWYWSERLGGDIAFPGNASENTAALLQMSNLSLSSKNVSTTHPFACEKAAPSKISSFPRYTDVGIKLIFCTLK